MKKSIFVLFVLFIQLNACMCTSEIKKVFSDLDSDINDILQEIPIAISKATAQSLFRKNSKAEQAKAIDSETNQIKESRVLLLEYKNSLKKEIEILQQ